VSNAFSFTVLSAEPVAPTITGVSPATPTQGTAAQGVYINGANFQSGLSIVLTAPGGSATPLPASAVAWFNATTCKMTTALTAAGTYSVAVQNPGGAASNVYSFTVQAAETPTPTVTGTSPSSPTQGTAAQALYVAGTNLQTGLSLVLTAPSGATATIGAADVTFGSSTVVRAMVMLVEAGNYSLRVANPGNVSSAPWTLTVKPATTGAR